MVRSVSLDHRNLFPQSNAKPHSVEVIHKMRLSYMSAHIKWLLCSALLVGCIMYGGPHAGLVAQKQPGKNDSWRELVSTEGRFRVLMPDIPEDRFVPVTGQIVKSRIARRTTVPFIASSAFASSSNAPRDNSSACSSGWNRVPTG